MAFVKCPKCELNYMLEGETCCPVCKKQAKNLKTEDLGELCVECGENPVVPGSQFCIVCLKEKAKEKLSDRIELDDLTDEEQELEEETPFKDDDIEIDTDMIIPERDLIVIQNELRGEDDEEIDDDEEDGMIHIVDVEDLDLDR